MIRTFRNKSIQAPFEDGRRLKGLPATVQRKAVIELQLLHAAENLQNLRVPPGNRLEALTGNRKGQYSIRVNDQYRVCFVWRSGNAYDVEIVDYH